MTLTPHEILKYLGINVPQEGITINPTDAFLHTQLLSLLGEHMKVDAIPVDDLMCVHAGMHAVAGRAQRDDEEPDAEQLERLRTSLRLVQKTVLGMAVD